jgi:hypothetical protein
MLIFLQIRKLVMLPLRYLDFLLKFHLVIRYARINFLCLLIIVGHERLEDFLLITLQMDSLVFAAAMIIRVPV